MDERLIHDVAATSRHILEVVAHCLREEEQPDALAEIYQRVRAGIEWYAIRHHRTKDRLKPGSNSR